MAIPEFIVVLSKLVLGAVATFLAILVWSKTREAAWVLVLSGAASETAQGFEELKEYFAEKKEFLLRKLARL